MRNQYQNEIPNLPCLGFVSEDLSDLRLEGAGFSFGFGFFFKSEALNWACNKDVPSCQYKHYNKTYFPVDCVESQWQGCTAFCISTVKNNYD